MDCQVLKCLRARRLYICTTDRGRGFSPTISAFYTRDYVANDVSIPAKRILAALTHCLQNLLAFLTL